MADILRIDRPTNTITFGTTGTTINIASHTASRLLALDAGKDLEVKAIGTDVQAFGAVLDDLNTLGAVGANSEFLVGTGAGALAWESGATVRTSLGLGINNNPQFNSILIGQLSLTGDIIIPSNGTIGQGAGALLTFDNANNYLEITGCNIGINDIAPAERLDINGNTNVTGVYKVDDVQVISNRVIDARCDDAINSGDATTDGVIDSLRDAMITHGLIAAS